MKIFSQKKTISLILIFLCNFCFSQDLKQKNDFWEKVQFGGGLGLGFGNNSTNISISPSAIYNFNPIVAMGIGFQYSYVKQKNYFHSNLYGGSINLFVNPMPQIQLSAELEEINVNTTYYNNPNLLSKNVWNTALFLGAGYRANNVTVGVRYNVLQNDNNNIYTAAFMPFVRVYF